MREIIFRGKRKDNGEWVEGYYARKGVDKDTFKHFICVMTFNVNGNTYSSMFYLTDIEVIPETVGQYTGLTDKNGTKIFEGDILKIIDGKEIIIASVKFGDYNQPDKILKTHIGFYFDIANLVSYRKDIGYWFGKTFSEIEVIGNVHDNPELLQD